jgi:hypothetical protein
MRRAILTLALLVLAGPLRAADAVWVEVTGYAAQSGAQDGDAARRRALADALYQAALAGGARVLGHTVVDRSVVTADLAIVRPVGRVVEHQVLSAAVTVSGMWQVSIRARVGAGDDGAGCRAGRKLLVTAYAAQITVAPTAPGWVAPVADDIAAGLLRQLDRHRAVDLIRVTTRAMPVAPPGKDQTDYKTLMRGSVRLAEGEVGFVPVIRVAQSGPQLEMTVEMTLIGQDGTVARKVVTRRVPLFDLPVLGKVGMLARPKRTQVAVRLMAGLDTALDALLDAESCKPVTARLQMAQGRITAAVGRNNGLTAGSIAFTADADASVQMLEVAALGAQSVTLRPLDPMVPAKSLAGRPVRFVETGM